MNDRLTDAELDELEAMILDATPGEWEAVLNEDPRGQPVPYYRSLICMVEHNPEGYLAVVAKNNQTVSRNEWIANTKLIAESRNTISRLIAEVREARKRK